MEYFENNIGLYDFIEEMNDQTVLVSILKQLLISLYISNKEIELVHNDLHLDNILCVKCNYDTVIKYSYNNNEYIVPTYGYILKYIDFGDAVTKFMSKNVLYKTQLMQYGNIPYYNTILVEIYSLFDDLCGKILKKNIDDEVCEIISKMRNLLDDTENDSKRLGSSSRLYIDIFYNNYSEIIKSYVRTYNKKSKIMKGDIFDKLNLIIISILEKPEYDSETIEKEEINVDIIKYVLKIFLAIERMFGVEKALYFFLSLVRELRLTNSNDKKYLINTALKYINANYDYNELEEITEISLIAIILNLKKYAKYLAKFYLKEYHFRVKLYIKFEHTMVSFDKIIYYSLKYLNEYTNNYYNLENTNILIKIENNTKTVVKDINLLNSIDNIY